MSIHRDWNLIIDPYPVVSFKTFHNSQPS